MIPQKQGFQGATTPPNVWPEFPKAPADLLDLPGFFQWQQSLNRWSDDVRWRLSDQQTGVTSKLSELVATSDAGLSARITHEEQVRADADTALAVSISTVAATAAGKAKISVQSTAPTSPSVNDLWIDTGDNNKAKYWDGATWQYKQDGVLAAAVSTEASARATADGFLQGKYTLTVVAGNVVTGMNITSSTGSGTNISNVIFQANSFQIWNSVTGQEVFDLTGTQLSISANVIIDGSLLVTGTVVASKLSVAQLSAITADLGIVTAGSVTALATIDVGTGPDRIHIDTTGLTGGYGSNITARVTNDIYTGSLFTGASLICSVGVHPAVIIQGVDAGSITPGAYSGQIYVLGSSGHYTIITNTSVSTTGNLSVGGKFLLSGDTRITAGNIGKTTADGWTPELYTGDDSTAGDKIEFQQSGGQIFARVNGGAPILLG
jgi:hypothetical protein